ncbi:MAG: response regulator [Acidobacteriota bacterium]
MSGYSPRLLIIDDDPDIREVVKLTFEHRGFEVDTLPDGIDAVQLKKDYHVILLDLNMPVFDGERLADYWSLTDPEVLQRVIVLSGYSRFVRGRPLPTFARVRKPFHTEELVEVVERCLAAN